MSKHEKIFQLTFLSIFIALIILLAFTPIGYLKVGLVEITFITIPVIVGATILGFKGGLILGFVFGLSSFIQVFTGSVFGELLFSISPLSTVIVCIVSRIIMGGLTGLLSDLLIKKKNLGTKLYPNIICSVCGSLFNTIFFTLFLVLFYYKNPTFISFVESNGLSSNNALLFMIAFVGVNGLVELGVNTIVCSAASSVYFKINNR